jgi:hypothetical protein
MVNRNDLKKRLKAADRRRNRRVAPQGPVVAASPLEPRVRPADLIANVLVGYAAAEQSATDIVAVAALRACSRGDLPAKEPARGLALKIEAVTKQPGVTPRSYRGAVVELLDAANLHLGKDSPDSFLDYLAILSEDV